MSRKTSWRLIESNPPKKSGTYLVKNTINSDPYEAIYEASTQSWTTADNTWFLGDYWKIKDE